MLLALLILPALGSALADPRQAICSLEGFESSLRRESDMTKQMLKLGKLGKLGKLREDH